MMTVKKKEARLFFIRLCLFTVHSMFFFALFSHSSGSLRSSVFLFAQSIFYISGVNFFCSFFPIEFPNRFFVQWMCKCIACPSFAYFVIARLFYNYCNGCWALYKDLLRLTHIFSCIKMLIAYSRAGRFSRHSTCSFVLLGFFFFFSRADVKLSSLIVFGMAHSLQQ